MVMRGDVPGRAFVYRPPASALWLSREERQQVDRLASALERTGLAWARGVQPQVASYRTDADFREAVLRGTGDPAYFGGWYDRRTHTVHMPGPGEGAGFDGPHLGTRDEWGKDLLHEMLHATRRGEALAEWAEQRGHPLVEGLVEIQTRALIAQDQVHLRVQLVRGSYGQFVYGVQSLMKPGQVTGLLTAADVGFEAFDVALMAALGTCGAPPAPVRSPKDWDCVQEKSRLGRLDQPDDLIRWLKEVRLV